MWIKICANTSLEDARLAAEAGADAVGFVFAPSRRQVTAQQAAEIGASLPPDPTQLGIFMQHTFDEIVAMTRHAGLHGIQLHGEFDPWLTEELRREFGHRQFLMQTLHWRVDDEASASEATLLEQYAAVSRQGVVDAVLLDAKTSTAAGGTGRTLPWKRLRDVLSSEPRGLRVVLAGGLRPENVAEAIGTLRPWGVDVASGVEQMPGKKDPVRVEAFIRNARNAFAAIENKGIAAGRVP
jgi:phosphoribosylanthranilate isomerase